MNLSSEKLVSKFALQIQLVPLHGGVLIFLTGQREVDALCKKLRWEGMYELNPGS